MTRAQIAGVAPCAPARFQTIRVSPHGIYHWPGIALAERRGEVYSCADALAVSALLRQFHGPQVLTQPLATAIRSATRSLEAGHVEEAQRRLDKVTLLPLSPNGHRLMHAIARRHGLAAPFASVAVSPSGTAWSDVEIEAIAKTYDRYRAQSNRLAKLFGSRPKESACGGPSKTPCDCGCRAANDNAPAEGRRSQLRRFNPNWDRQSRVPVGQSDGGQWTANSGGTSTSVQSSQNHNLRPAQAITIEPPIARPIPFPFTPPFPTDIVPPIVSPDGEYRKETGINPYPNNPKCVKEWDDAYKICGRYLKEGKIGKDPQRHVAPSHLQCLYGQVSAACGGKAIKWPRGRGRRPEA